MRKKDNKNVLALCRSYFFLRAKHHEMNYVRVENKQNVLFVHPWFWSQMNHCYQFFRALEEFLKK